MTLSETLIVLGFFLGLGFVTAAYMFTERGSSLGADTMKANRKSRWWMRKGYWAAHWPFILLIVLFTFGYFGVVVAAM